VPSIEKEMVPRTRFESVHSVRSLVSVLISRFSSWAIPAPLAIEIMMMAMGLLTPRASQYQPFFSAILDTRL